MNDYWIEYLKGNDAVMKSFKDERSLKELILLIKNPVIKEQFTCFGSDNDICIKTDNIIAIGKPLKL